MAHWKCGSNAGIDQRQPDSTADSVSEPAQGSCAGGAFPQPQHIQKTVGLLLYIIFLDAIMVFAMTADGKLAALIIMLVPAASLLRRVVPMSSSLTDRHESAQSAADNFAMHVRQTIVAALKFEGQF